MIKYIAMVLLVFAPSLVFAGKGDYTLEVPITAFHHKDGYTENGVKRDYNRNNTGYGMHYGISATETIGLVAFRNSYYQQGGMLAYNRVWPVHTGSNWVIEPGVTAALVVGYKGTSGDGNVIGGPFSIAAAPGIVVGYNRFRANFMYVPGVVGTVSVQWVVGKYPNR